MRCSAIALDSESMLAARSNAPSVRGLDRPQGQCVNVNGTVFIVDAEEAERIRIASVLQRTAPDIRAFANAEQFFEQLQPSSSGCVLVAADLPGLGARALLAEIRRRKLSIAVVAIDRKHDVATAVELMRAGAFDVIAYPLTARRLREIVRTALGGLA